VTLDQSQVGRRQILKQAVRDYETKANRSSEDKAWSGRIVTLEQSPSGPETVLREQVLCDLS
jgi:hypothetical protein